jgi:TRAP-type mannitol/chloroaromatic compound transport system permease small subunit
MNKLETKIPNYILMIIPHVLVVIFMKTPFLTNRICTLFMSNVVGTVPVINIYL